MRIIRVTAFHGLKLWPARPHCGQEGEHLRFSPSCQSTPFPSGRAARVRASDAFRLPPGCRIKASGTAATPERCAYRLLHPPCRGARCAPARHPAGAPPSWKHWAQALHRQHPRPRGQAQNPTAATLSQIKFFHSMWINLFAVAGSHERLPAGVIRKRGRSAPPSRAAASVHASNRRFAAALSES